MVPLHYGNMHIHVIDKRFFTAEKKRHISEEKL